jgi:hypothetical protein
MGYESLFYTVAVGELAGSDRITVARIAGVSSRRAAQRLNGQCSDAEAVAELAEVARGRADLLAEHAGVIIGATEGELAMQAGKGREQARLCVLAGADPDALAPWIEVGRERKRQARLLPFSGPTTVS